MKIVISAILATMLMVWVPVASHSQSFFSRGGSRTASADAIVTGPGTVEFVSITNSGAADCTIQMCDSLTFAGCTNANSIAVPLVCVFSTGRTCVTPSHLDLGFVTGLSVTMTGAGCTYNVSTKPGS